MYVKYDLLMTYYHLDIVFEKATMTKGYDVSESVNTGLMTSYALFGEQFQSYLHTAS